MKATTRYVNVEHHLVITEDERVLLVYVLGTAVDQQRPTLILDNQLAKLQACKAMLTALAGLEPIHHQPNTPNLAHQWVTPYGEDSAGLVLDDHCKVCGDTPRGRYLTCPGS